VTDTGRSRLGVMPGRCFMCNEIYEGEYDTHFEQKHSRGPSKPRLDIMSWEHRIDKIIEDLQAIRQSDDVAIQVRSLDENVIVPVYLVRATLAAKLVPAQQREGR
jgi:hypothetical protein